MLRKEKASVRDFYNNFGWITDTDGNYRDTTSFADNEGAAIFKTIGEILS
jgi:hypothetical protein